MCGTLVRHVNITEIGKAGGTLLGIADFFDFTEYQATRRSSRHPWRPYLRSGGNNPGFRLQVDAQRQCILAMEEGFEVEAVLITIVVREDHFAAAEQPASLRSAIA